MIAIRPISKKPNSGTTDPDAQLMLRVGRGDRAAFETLVESYYERVEFVIEHLLGNRNQTDDLAQEVFMRVYRARESYRPESKFSTWLFVIVNNVVRNARRSAGRKREVQLRETPPNDELMFERTLYDYRMPSPSENLLRGEARKTVREAVRELNARQREAITLYHFTGLSYSEVAKEMETTLCAAKALLHRARASLRGQLDEYQNA